MGMAMTLSGEMGRGGGHYIMNWFRELKNSQGRDGGGGGKSIPLPSLNKHGVLLKKLHASGMSCVVPFFDYTVLLM